MIAIKKPKKYDFSLERNPIEMEDVHANLPGYKNAFRIETVDCKDLTVETFHRKYVDTRTPVVIKNACKSWTAFEKWEEGYLRETIGEQKILVTKCLLLDFLLHAANEKLSKKAYWALREKWAENLSMSDYLDLCTTKYDPKGCLYARDVELPREILEDIEPYDFYEGNIQGQTWFVGCKTYTDSHEHHGADAFLNQVRGTKEVIMHPSDPEHYKAMYSDPALRLWSPVRFFDVDLERFPLFEHSKPQLAVVEPGDSLFIPDAWWHSVQSFDSKLSITVTQWCDPPWLDLSILQTRIQLLEQPLTTLRNFWKFGVKL
tara:strand:+ start:3180 stop:4130 length:951 start_codon:yes stop_codon:yes gene_type:complete